jgi:hypothetical protein
MTDGDEREFISLEEKMRTAQRLEIGPVASVINMLDK